MSTEVVVVTEPGDTIVIESPGDEDVSVESGGSETVIEVGIAGPQGAGVPGPPGEAGGGSLAVFQVRDFDGVLDGETDDTQAFFDANDAAYANGGGIIEFDGPTVISEMIDIVTGLDGVGEYTISLRGVGKHTSRMRWADGAPKADAFVRFRGDNGTGSNSGAHCRDFSIQTDGSPMSRGIWQVQQHQMAFADLGFRGFAEGGLDACIEQDYEGPSNSGCLLNTFERIDLGMGGVNDNWGIVLQGHRNRVIGLEAGGTRRGSVRIAGNVGGTGNIIAYADLEGLVDDGTWSIWDDGDWTRILDCDFEDLILAGPDARSIYCSGRHPRIIGNNMGYIDIVAEHSIELNPNVEDATIAGQKWASHATVADIKVDPACTDVRIYDDDEATVLDPGGVVKRYADLADLLAHTADADAHGDFLTAAEADAAYDVVGAAGAVAAAAAAADAAVAADAADADADHVADTDPHGDRAAATTDATTKANAAQAAAIAASDPTGTAAAGDAAHAGAGDPHPGYLTSAEGNAAYDAAGAAAAGDAAHAGAADPHAGYQKESEKDALSGYPGLTAGGFILPGQLGSGAPSAAKVLRGDGAWTTHDGTGDPHGQYLQESAAAAVATTGSASDLGAGTLPVARIADGALALTKLANISNLRLLGNLSGASGPPLELTPAQAETLLANELMLARLYMPTGALAETWPRAFAPGTNQAVLQGSGQIYCAVIALAAGMTVSAISWLSGVQAAVAPTFQQSGLYNFSTLARLAQSADGTNSAWAATTIKPFTMTTPYLIPTTALYWITLVVTAGTLPSLWVLGNFGAALHQNAAPKLVGRANVGVTSLPDPIATVDNSYTHRVYAYVS